MRELNQPLNPYTRDNHVFISNTTKQPFITSDNPIINIHTSLGSLDHGRAPSNADFYIPLSPRYAYMINDSAIYNGLSDSIDENMVNKLNFLVLENSHRTVFASSKNVLTNIKSQKNTV